MKLKLSAVWVRVKSFCKKWVSPIFLFLFCLELMFSFAAFYYLSLAVDSGLFADGDSWVKYCFSIFDDFSASNFGDCAFIYCFLIACASVFGCIAQIYHVLNCLFVMIAEHFFKCKKST